MLDHIGTDTIETKRLMLRRFKFDDAENMFNNWAKDPENVKYLQWQAHHDIGETNKILIQWIRNYKNKNYYQWCITLKGSDEAIGSIGIVELFESKECGTIGYVLSKKYWNKGIMTEALQEVLNYLFKKVGFHRIQSMHDIDNPASGKVMLKNGMKYEETLRKYDKTNVSGWCDTPIYSIIKEEFLKRGDFLC